MLQTIENYVAIQSHFFINFNLKPVSETGRKAIQNGSGRLRCLQDAPRSCQKASKKLPRDPKTASRGRKSLHGHPKLPPRRFQTLQKSQKAFHDAPRGLPDAPKPPGWKSAISIKGSPATQEHSWAAGGEKDVAPGNWLSFGLLTQTHPTPSKHIKQAFRCSPSSEVKTWNQVAKQLVIDLSKCWSTFN